FSFLHPDRRSIPSLALHDALPISASLRQPAAHPLMARPPIPPGTPASARPIQIPRLQDRRTLARYPAVLRSLRSPVRQAVRLIQDRKSTRLNSSHVKISYAVFCLK